MTNKFKLLEIDLTKENAKHGLLIISKDNPEWGIFVMQDYDSRVPCWNIRGDRGVRVLFESEFKFWKINKPYK
jgi:hypothetical protein